MAYDGQETAPGGGLLTGEAVAVELPVARLGTRTLAITIDAACEYLLFYLFQLGLSSLLLSGDTAAYTIGLLLSIILTFLVWPIAFETVSRGRSPGKMALGLRVVRAGRWRPDPVPAGAGARPGRVRAGVAGPAARADRLADRVDHAALQWPRQTAGGHRGRHHRAAAAAARSWRPDPGRAAAAASLGADAGPHPAR
ncbi:RDD family protein [Fodinicola feengrottensis]|uniref:RDD family protein n=1 Tax=Fodinicola feengrottensis TaxID=435914 RepID=UPI002442E7C3|nr:RDD family protein [Fodinicola feengrottensis]